MTNAPEKAPGGDGAAAAADDRAADDGAADDGAHTARPTTADAEAGLHHGSLFFAMPNGKTASFALVGVAKPPEAEPLPKDIQLQTPCKKSLTLLLPVRNWLKTALQRFTVTIDVDQSTRRETTFLRGPTTIVVPEQSSRMYKLSFQAWTPGNTAARVTFTNEQTGEYLFYDLKLDAAEPAAGSAGTLQIDSTCRQSARQLITLENPLPPAWKVKLPEKWWKCNNRAVRVRRRKDTGPLEGSMDIELEVEYRPLVETPADAPAEAALELDLGKELGHYRYTLMLSASKAGANSTLSFKVPLGSMQRRTFRFQSHVKDAETYSCSVTRPLFFEVAAQVSAPAAGESWDGATATVDVVFEPEKLGEVVDTLTIKSASGGEFKCALKGECTPPLPRGPIELAAGGSTTVAFKNVFNESRTFVCLVDNPAFAVSPAEKEVAAKAQAEFTVSYTVPASAAGDDAAAKKDETPEEGTGKLLISCPELKGMPPWVYYLAGGGGAGSGGAVKEPVAVAAATNSTSAKKRK